jgi:hypothetical protein
MSESARALSALQSLDAGCSREQWVRIGMAAKSAGLSLDDFTDWSRNAENFQSGKDCRQVWASFNDGPVTGATLYKLAFDAGWNDPAKSTHNGHKAHHEPRTRANPSQAEKKPQRALESVAELWERFSPAPATHPYINAKNGLPDGLKVVPDGDSLRIAGQVVTGWLVVPALSVAGEIQTLQFIPPPGTDKKLNLPGASFGPESLFSVGNLSESPRALVVEGIGQAWACWRATGHAAVVTFGAGRMATVTESLRRHYPTLPVVLVPDKGKESQAAEIARNHGVQWVEMPADKPSNYDANDYAAEFGSDALAELLDNPRSPAMRYRLLSAAEVANQPPLHWLVRGLLPQSGIAAAYGPSGCGKSFLTLDLGASIAAGAEWFGHRVRQAPVVYLALEGEAGFSGRVKAWQLHHQRELPPALRFILQPFNLRSPQDIAEIVQAVTLSGGAGGLLILDTLNRAASGADENSSQDMGQLIEASKALQTALGGCVLLVHHSGKDSSKGLRGHSSLHAALDAAIEVARIGDGREWKIAKAKDGSDSESHPFKLVVVEIGTHDDGEAITSCAVEAVQSPQRQFRRVLPPNGGNQKIAWDCLGESLRRAGDGRPTDAPESLPQNRPTVTVEAAVQSIGERLACEPKRKPERARAALTGLCTRGLIAIDGGYLWVT